MHNILWRNSIKLNLLKLSDDVVGQKIIGTELEEEESQKFKWTVWIYGELNGKKFSLKLFRNCTNIMSMLLLT